VPALTLVLAALPLSALELKKYASGRGIDANVCSLTPRSQKLKPVQAVCKGESEALNWAFWEVIENKYWHYCPSHRHTFSNCLSISQSFSHNTAALYTEQCTSPLLFTTLKSYKVVQTGHWRTMASFLKPFSSLVCMHTCMGTNEPWPYKRYIIIVTTDHWSRNTISVFGDRERLSSIVDSVFEWMSSQWSLANTAYIYWGTLWGQTCCSVIDGKLQLM